MLAVRTLRTLLVPHAASHSSAIVAAVEDTDIAGHMSYGQDTNHEVRHPSQEVVQNRVSVQITPC